MSTQSVQYGNFKLPRNDYVSQTRDSSPTRVHTTEAEQDIFSSTEVGGNDEPSCSGEKKTVCGSKRSKVPNKPPDLSNHLNLMAEVLKSDPSLYEKLKGRKTSTGCTIMDLIKTGIDNPTHPHIKTCGIVAGDEDSYETFRELFDPIICTRHGGYLPNALQPTNIDIDKLSKTDIDPTGKYVLTSRVRTGRSIRGFKLPPCISFDDRRKLEVVLVKSLLSMTGEFKGDYFPLHGSQSYAPKPQGMSQEKEKYIRKAGCLFQEPDSPLLLASGMGRHWPDARGVFHNNNANLFVWFGEEDHLRIISMQGNRAQPTPEGKNIREVVARFISACNDIERILKNNGKLFMYNKHHGYILTCPSNLGTGLRAGCMVMLPHISARPDWKELLAVLRLQARGTAGVDSASTEGCWDISNADRMGKGEIDLCNILIEGLAQLVKWEMAYDAGNNPSAEIADVIGGKKITTA